jgi:hypothetical protein
MCGQLLACLQNCSLPFLYRHDTWYLSLVCSIIPAGIRCIKYIERGTRWRSWLRHNAKSREASGSIVVGFSGIFHWHNHFRPHYDPWFDSFSNRNEYQKYFLGGKIRRCIWLTTLPLSQADCLKIWEPQSPAIFRACPGLYRILTYKMYKKPTTVIHFMGVILLFSCHRHLSITHVAFSGCWEQEYKHNCKMFNP